MLHLKKHIVANEIIREK